MIQFTRPLLLFLLAIPLIAAYVFRDKWKRYLLRLFVIILIVLAIAGPRLSREELTKNAFFVIDSSPSVQLTTDKGEIVNRVKEIADINEDYNFGVVSFSDQSRLEVGLEEEIDTTADKIDFISGKGTNLKAGVTLAASGLSQAEGNQLVLISDGQITSGYHEAISFAKQRGLPISVVPVGQKLKNDVILEEIELPEEVESGRPFEINLTVRSQRQQEAKLFLYRGEQLTGNWNVDLQQGVNTYQVGDQIDEAGLYEYRAVISSPDDPIPENNSLSGVVQVSEIPSTLVVSQTETRLPDILRGIDKEFETSSSIPSLEELAKFRTVIFAGFDMSNISGSSVQRLKKYVSEMGGGVLFIQGQHELKNLPQSRIEGILPVTYRTPELRKEPHLSVVYVLDISGSMQSRVGGATKIEILTETAAASIDLLDEQDMAGVISFDSEFRWEVPLQRVRNKEQIYEGLKDLRAAGGTDLYYPLQAAMEELNNVQGRVKHIVAITDGKTVTEDRDYPGLLARLRRNDDLTVSTIATGSNPNLNLLNQIADSGGGQSYRAGNFADLPRISMNITEKINRDRFVTGDLDLSGPLMSGELARLPSIDGYVLTYPKQEAKVWLRSGRDPIFAHWQFGLGKVGVLNTDLRGVWSENWMKWPRTGFLVETLVDKVEPIQEPASYQLEPQLEIGEDRLEVKLEARSLDGSFANFLDLKGRIGADNQYHDFSQQAPGRYELEIEKPSPGGYAFQIFDETRGKRTVVPFSVPYSSEFRNMGINEQKLQQITDLTGGKVLESETLPPVDAGNKDVTREGIHFELLYAGLALFMVDLIRRKFD